MQIKNEADREIDVQVAGKSSKTLWTATVRPGETIGKDLPEDDKPYTPYGRWAADPALGYNFIFSFRDPRPTVPDNSYTVVVEQTVPCFISGFGS